MTKDLIRIDGTAWHAGRLRSTFQSVSVQAAAFGVGVMGVFALVQTHSLPWWQETAVTASSMLFIAASGWAARRHEVSMCETFHESAASKGIRPDADRNMPNDRSDGFLNEVHKLRTRCRNDMIEGGLRVVAGVPAVGVSAWAIGWNFTAFSLMTTLISLPSLARGIALHRRCNDLLERAQKNQHTNTPS